MQLTRHIHLSRLQFTKRSTFGFTHYPFVLGLYFVEKKIAETDIFSTVIFLIDFDDNIILLCFTY